MTLVWVGPGTMRKSWMVMPGSMSRTMAATRSRVSAVSPSSLTTGSMWMVARHPSSEASSRSAESTTSWRARMSPEAGTSA